MSKLTKMVTEPLDVGILKIKLGQALDKVFTGKVDPSIYQKFDEVLKSVVQAKGETHRKRELHVSDFTGSEKEFCHRKLVVRYLNGEKKGYKGSWVQYDGKWREAKWWMLFEAAGILREYQPSLSLGGLQGHPDFVVDFGKGPCIVELTGHDSKIDMAMRMMRLHVKRRQNTIYQLMWKKGRPEQPLHGGFVFIEDKGNNTFSIEPIEIDPDKAVVLLERIILASTYCRSLEKAVDKDERIALYREIPKCGRERCQTCNPK